MLGRVSSKCVCPCCPSLNLHETQTSEEGIIISLPPNLHVSLLEAQCPCSSGDHHSPSQAFLEFSHRVRSHQHRAWWGGHTPFLHDPLLGMSHSWGLHLVVTGWREFGSSSVSWLTGYSPGAPPSGCLLLLSTRLTHCHVNMLSWPFLIKSTRVFPVPVSPLCIFQSSTRWSDKLILVHVLIRESWCTAWRVVEGMPLWNLKTVQMSSCVICCKLLNISEFLFPGLKNGVSIITHLSSWQLDE